MNFLIGKSIFLGLVLVSSSVAGLVNGTVTLDGNVIHYQAYSGTDPAMFQQFLQGANLVNFESVPGVTALAVNSYNTAPTTAANLIDPTIALGGAYVSAGGQTPGNPANGGNPAALVDVSALNGAHSGNNVLGPTAQGDPTEPLDFANGFISVNFPLLQPISRFGWWTNPNGGNVAFAPHINTFDAGNNMVDLSTGITFTANAGDFVAFAFDTTLINEVELFQSGPMTVDDFTFARDHALPFGAGGGTTVPEPASLFLSMLCGIIALPVLLKVRASHRRRNRWDLVGDRTSF